MVLNKWQQRHDEIADMRTDEQYGLRAKRGWWRHKEGGIISTEEDIY